MKLAFYKAWQKEATWLDCLIAVASLGKHSHVEMIFATGESFSISASTKVSKVYLGTKEYLEEEWDLLELDLSAEEDAETFETIHDYLNFKYDHLGAVFSIFRTCEFEDRKKFFCSELVVEVLRKFTKYKWLKKGCKYNPSRLYRKLKKG